MNMQNVPANVEICYYYLYYYLLLLFIYKIHCSKIRFEKIIFIQFTSFPKFIKLNFSNFEIY